MGGPSREGDDAGSTAALARGRGGRLGRGEQPGLAEVCGVGVARRLALHYPYTGSPVPSRGHLLDLPIVQVGRGRSLVLDIDLGELGSGAQPRTEDPLDDVGIDHVRAGDIVGHAAEPTDGPNPRPS